MNLKSLYSLLPLALLGANPIPPAGAAGFGAGISPTKFELRAKPGAILRDTLTILNASEATAEYNFRTADWRLNDSQGVDFFEDQLLANSCRPWVRLERKVARIRAGGQKKYRFEVHVPADTQPGLCTFAVLIEPGATAIASIGTNQQIKVPVVGRYAAIVYVTVGNAKADMEFLGIGKKQIGERYLPTLRFHNSGNTYDRAFGRVMATDATGKRYELIASSFPVLPHRSEDILLSPQARQTNQQPIELIYPIQLKGVIEIGGQNFAIDEIFNLPESLQPG